MVVKEYLDRTKERSAVHAMRGKYATSRGTRLIMGALEAYDRDGTFLFKVIKSSMKKADRDRLVSLTRDCVKVAKNHVRGAAAGPLKDSDVLSTETKINTFTKASKSGFESNKAVHSCVVGMTRSMTFSQWTKDNIGVIDELGKIVAGVDASFKDVLLETYNIMAKKAGKMPWTFRGSVFSSVTVNKNFRTGIHMDNNRKYTYSAMVIAGDRFEGGHLVFPEYSVSVDLVPGDLIVFDSRLYHGNSQIKKAKDSDRFSFVFYQK